MPENKQPESVPVEIVPAQKTAFGEMDSISTIAPSGMMERRKSLIRSYHGGHLSLKEKLESEGRLSFENLLVALVDEVVTEGEHLLGNELIATEDGNLRDATIISVKRADVIEKAIKAVQAKQIFEREHGIDVDTPAMRVVFEFFLYKVKRTFESLGYGDEMSDTFFRMLLENMKNWKKELKEELKSMPIGEPGAKGNEG